MRIPKFSPCVGIVVSPILSELLAIVGAANVSSAMSLMEVLECKFNFGFALV